MSLEELVKDCKRNGNAASIIEAGVDAPTATYLADVMWPVIQALAEEAVEIEEDLAESIEQTEDLLHAETAAYFAAHIEIGRQIAKKLEGTADPDLQRLLISQANIASQCEAVLLEITIPDGEDPDDDEDDDDEEEDDDDAK